MWPEIEFCTNPPPHDPWNLRLAWVETHHLYLTDHPEPNLKKTLVWGLDLAENHDLESFYPQRKVAVEEISIDDAQLLVNPHLIAQKNVDLASELYKSSQYAQHL